MPDVPQFSPFSTKWMVGSQTLTGAVQRPGSRGLGKLCPFPVTLPSEQRLCTRGTVPERDEKRSQREMLSTAHSPLSDAPLTPAIPLKFTWPNPSLPFCASTRILILRVSFFCRVERH
jgi:hypothetical protein